MIGRTEIVATVLLAVTHAAAWWGGHDYRDDKAEQERAELELKQERLNNEHVENYNRVAQAYVDHFRANPVRVLLKGGCGEGSGPVHVDPESVVLTVGGARAGQREEAR